MRKSNIFIRNIKNRIFKGLVIFLSILSTVPLFLILFFIFEKGITSINWQFFISLPKPVGEAGGGIANALVGTFLLVTLSSIISIPIGLTAGIYLSEFKKSKVSYWVRLCVDILQGVPSIVIGIIAYLWVVKQMGHFSAFSGAIALAMMMLPVIVKSTEETLKLMPESLKEASLALGVPYYRTIIKVILPAGLSGIITGILLSVSRVAGETAPLLFTAFGSPFMNWNINKPVHSLPLLIFNYAISPYDDWHKIAWGAAFVLVIFILLLNLIAKGVAGKWKIQF